MKEEEDDRTAIPRALWTGKRPSLARDLILRESPNSADTPKHVVVVMDGLKEFTTEPVEWVLENIAFYAYCKITLVGVMPWLNIPLFSKTFSDIWTLDIEDLFIIKERSEWKSDVKYQKIQRLLDLCQKYGVVPQMRTKMGYPLELVAVEHIVNLHAALVVFDRYHRKYRQYYAERIPCNMVMMNDDGGVDMIKGRPLIDNGENTPGESPVSAPSNKVDDFRKSQELSQAATLRNLSHV
ncbi:hypothetical protein F0562_007730 [Nyssa sinensis]|uniref:Uncharacterized protein n=1 Tax=Nyssa sinensis TaxID=561372 RepID=A0A5J5A461_9ASTE|nr:hypothetical protein F0562_007730 [Nyssa sinensis]